MKITEAILKVKRQKKNEKGMVIMDAMLSSKKKDGGYYNPMWLSLYLGDKTEWVKADYREQYVKVSGTFTHSDWEKNGKSGKNFTVFVDKLEKYEFEKKSDDFMTTDSNEELPF